MNAKISVFVFCVEGIVCLLLYNMHDYTFKEPLKQLQFVISAFGLKIKQPEF